MEQARNKDNGEEPDASSQVPAQPNESESEKAHPHVSGDTIQTAGGAYVVGPVTNKGAFTMLGGNIAGGVHIDYHGPMPPLTTSPTHPPSYLPFFRNPLFQPRPGEFEHLESLLLRPHEVRQLVRVGLVGVTGMGGIGKTQLAVEFAYCYQDRFPGGIFWMPATGHTFFDWQRQFADLALNTNYLPADDDMSNPENEARRARHFCRYLAGQTDALLILDNVEDPNLVLSVLPGLAGKEPVCAILYTSRSTLTPPGITLHSVELLPEDAALRLLLESTRPKLFAKVIANHQDEEADAARFICQKIDYLPLALVHLRSLLEQDRHVPLTHLADALSQRGILGVTDAVTAIFQLSWTQVRSEHAQRLFLLLSCFPEATPIPLWLLGIVSGLGEQTDIFTPLGRARFHLQELSLLEELAGEQVRVHPLVREFSMQLVHEAGDAWQGILAEADKNLWRACGDISWLEQRARQHSYWTLLQHVRAMLVLTENPGLTTAHEHIKSIEQCLDQKSFFLSGEDIWTTWPEQFYQELYNYAVDAQLPIMHSGVAPSRWLRQLEPVIGARTRIYLRTFSTNREIIKSMAFSPDGRYILAGCVFSREVYLWNANTGQELQRLHTLTGGVIAMVGFSEDGRALFAVSTDGIDVWDVHTLNHISSIASTDTMNQYVSQQGIILLSEREQMTLLHMRRSTLSMYELPTGKEVRTIEIEGFLSSYLAVSPDHRQIATGTDYGRLQLWDLATGNEIRRFQLRKRYLAQLAFSPDGTQLLAVTSGGSIFRCQQGQRAWTCEQVSKIQKELKGDELRSVAFSPDRRLVLITWELFPLAGVYEVASGKKIGETTEGYAFISRALFSPDGASILVQSGQQIHLRTLQSKQGAQRHEKEWLGEVEVAFARDGKQLLTLTRKGVVHFYHLEQQEERMLQNQGPIQSMAFSRDGKRIITGSTDGHVTLWDSQTGKVLWSFTPEAKPISQVAFSTHEQRILVWQDLTISFYEDREGEFICTKRIGDQQELRSHQSFYGDEQETIVALSSDERLFLTIFHRSAWVREVASGQIIREMQGFAARDYMTGDFSPNNEYVLTLGNSEHIPTRVLRLWNVKSGEMVGDFSMGTGTETSYMGFSPDSRCLVICYRETPLCLFIDMQNNFDAFGAYIAHHPIGGVAWVDERHVLLAEALSFGEKPHIYRLLLEGL